MVDRLGSQITRSPSMADLRFKILRIVRRHEQLKTGFTKLKSQIKSGLLEAEDVFASLSIPLMKFVGLKTEEIAEEGRSSTIFMESNFQQPSCRRNFPGSETPEKSPFPAKSREQHHRLEEESYSFRATQAGKALSEKQRLQLQQLVYLLRRIEAHVNSRQENILQTLDNHRVSLHKFFRKSISYLSAIHRTSETHETALVVTLKLLRATYDHVGSALGSVEGCVQDLMHELAEHMCTPMVEYVKVLKAEMAAGTLTRLVAVVKEMEGVMRDGRLELEEARKKVRVEEERKLEALSRLRESEKERRAMMEFVGFLLEAKKRSKEPNVPQMFLAMEGDGVGDVKILWDLLNEKNKSQSQASPLGTKELLQVKPDNKHLQLKGNKNVSSRVKPMVSRKPVTWSFTRAGLSPESPCPDSWPRLGSSPSVGDQRDVERKRISSLIRFKKVHCTGDTRSWGS